jgi:hypothetical protein
VKASTQPVSLVTAGAHVNPGSAHSGNRGSASATTTASLAKPPVTTGTLPAAVLVVNNHGWSSIAT